MSRENRRKALSAALGLLGLLAASGTAAAWELPLDRWHFQGAEIGRLWQQAWSGVGEILGVAATVLVPDAGQGQSPSSATNALGTPGNNSEHSAGIDPNG